MNLILIYFYNKMKIFKGKKIKVEKNLNIIFKKDYCNIKMN